MILILAFFSFNSCYGIRNCTLFDSDPVLFSWWYLRTVSKCNSLLHHLTREHVINQLLALDADCFCLNNIYSVFKDTQTQFSTI